MPLPKKPKTAKQWAAEHAKTVSKDKATMVCAALETVKPFRHWFGWSGQGHKWDNLPATLQAKVPRIGAGIQEWGSANCAEIDAAVRAINKGANIDNLVFAAAEAAVGTLRKPCLNCAKWAKQG